MSSENRLRKTMFYNFCYEFTSFISEANKTKLSIVIRPARYSSVKRRRRRIIIRYCAIHSSSMCCANIIGINAYLMVQFWCLQKSAWSNQSKVKKAKEKENPSTEFSQPFLLALSRVSDIEKNYFHFLVPKIKRKKKHFHLFFGCQIVRVEISLSQLTSRAMGNFLEFSAQTATFLWYCVGSKRQNKLELFHICVGLLWTLR